MTIYALIYTGEIKPATLFPCFIKNCDSEILIPADKAPAQVGFEHGWTGIDSRKAKPAGAPGHRAENIVVTELMCHRHVVSPVEAPA